MKQAIKIILAELDRLQQSNALLSATLLECTDKLEETLQVRYGNPVHPSHVKKKELDMLVVKKSRLLLRNK